MAGLAVVFSGLSGCHLFCDRYCDRERDRCQQYNRGCCAPAPVAQCQPACPPAPGTFYPPPQQCCPAP
jgi:hypothetical protein